MDHPLQTHLNYHISLEDNAIQFDTKSQVFWDETNRQLTLINDQEIIRINPPKDDNEKPTQKLYYKKKHLFIKNNKQIFFLIRLNLNVQYLNRNKKTIDAKFSTDQSYISIQRSNSEIVNPFFS